MHVRARLALPRHTVDGAGGLAIDKDDALVALDDIRHEFLHHHGLAADLAEKLVQRAEIAVRFRQAEDPGPAAAIERFDDDVAMFGPEITNGRKGARYH